MKRIVKLLFALCLLAGLCTQVFAQPVPDLSQTGTIRIVLQKGEEPVAGGTLTLYRVGQIHNEDENYSFVLTDAFARAGESLADLQASGLADRLFAYAQKEKLPGVTAAVDTSGAVSFSDLELGLYLIVQEQPAPGWNAVSPFLVSVPYLQDGTYVYIVDASPKVEPEKAPPTEPTQPDDPKLPQTGALNGLVPLMAVGGMLLLFIGVLLCSRRRRGQG